MAIYVWFVLWMFLMLAMAAGVYALLVRLMSPTVVQWVLLPGTIVSEVAYMFGVLITGGEIRRRVLPGKEGGGDGVASTGGKPRTFGAVVASVLSIVAVVATLVWAYKLLDEPVIGKFIGLGLTQLGKSGVSSFGELSGVFWEQVRNQVSLLERLTGTLTKVNWFDWRVPLLVYLTLCLSVRMWPAGRPIRPTLIGVVILAGVIATIGAIWTRFESLLSDLWPLLTYVWTSLLLLLVLALAITGATALVRALSGKGSANA